MAHDLLLLIIACDTLGLDQVRSEPWVKTAAQLVVSKYEACLVK